jgi:hypothetical protein
MPGFLMIHLDLKFMVAVRPVKTYGTHHESVHTSD